MLTVSVQIDFPNRPKLDLSSIKEEFAEKEIPEWAYFDKFPCPGNALHGPDISYCRLACQLRVIIDYFNEIKSFEKGSLLVSENNSRETTLTGDAQTIFFNTCWILLLKTDCSVFKQDMVFRRHYALMPDTETIFYAFWSIFLVRNYSPTQPTASSVEKFSEYIDLVADVLESLRGRIIYAASHEGDSCQNGIIIFENIVQLFKLNFKKYLAELSAV